MELKSLLGVLLISLVFAFSACDDDLNSVGSSIQSGGNQILVKADTAYVLAKTISLNDSVFARTTSGLLGRYNDDTYGNIKSDYLSEFYSRIMPEDKIFQDNVEELDSIQFTMDFLTFAGDSLAPMGVSVYKVTTPLRSNFFTNINPSDYCDMSKPLGQKGYTVANAIKTYYNGTLIRTVAVDIDMQLAQDLYDESIRNRNTFLHSDSLRKFLPGVYVTPTFGSGSLINVYASQLNIFYKYTQKNGTSDGLRDTIRSTVFMLAVTPEVIQLNHVQNSGLENLIGSGTETPDSPYAYLKSPAGVCTSLTFPIEEIKAELAKIGSAKTTTINQAKFNIKGNSEMETGIKYDFGRPPYLLLVDRDSVNTFFINKRLTDGKTKFYATWDSSTNTYSFNNIAGLVNEYKDRELTKDPEFLLLPIDITWTTVGYTQTPSRFYNYLKPSFSILRSSKDDMRLELMYSKIE